MEQIEFRKRMIQAEKDIIATCNWNSLDIINTLYKNIFFDSEAGNDLARKMLKNIKEEFRQKATSVFLEIGEQKIYFDPNILYYQKIGKLFSDLAEMQKNKYENNLKKYGDELDICHMWLTTAEVLDEAYDVGYNLLAKFGIEDYDKKTFVTNFKKETQMDIEVVVSRFLTDWENTLLDSYWKKEDIIQWLGDGRSELVYSAEELTEGILLHIGVTRETDKWVKLLIKKSKGQVSTYSNYILAHIQKLGEYISDILIANNKFPEVKVSDVCEELYDFYLWEFLCDQISSKDFADILLTIMSASFGNKRIQEGILDFLGKEDRQIYVTVRKWMKEYACYYKRIKLQNDIFAIKALDNQKFSELWESDKILFNNPIEWYYCNKRYQSICEEEKPQSKETFQQSHEFYCVLHLKELEEERLLKKQKEAQKKAEEEERVVIIHRTVERVQKIIYEYAGTNNIEDADGLLREFLIRHGLVLKAVSTTIFCSHCGKKISRSAKFCNFCGQKNNYSRKE